VRPYGGPEHDRDIGVGARARCAGSAALHPSI
jgi:hypothetical protein